ncbi:hypothetical protein VP424E501_P0246 [Vibrio phage 424E50-1]|nr:hypothetical protein VP424E501_P0246 [Vibrio phage 424E50-1]
MDMYPTGSELCIRLTGDVYNYFHKVYEERKFLDKKSTRDQAILSAKRQEAIRVLKKLHKPYFQFAKELGTTNWILDKKGGNLFIIFY